MNSNYLLDRILEYVNHCIHDYERQGIDRVVLAHKTLININKILLIFIEPMLS